MQCPSAIERHAALPVQYGTVSYYASPLVTILEYLSFYSTQHWDRNRKKELRRDRGASAKPPTVIHPNDNEFNLLGYS